MSLTIQHGDAIIGAGQNSGQIDFALVGAASRAQKKPAPLAKGGL